MDWIVNSVEHYDAANDRALLTIQVIAVGREHIEVTIPKPVTPADLSLAFLGIVDKLGQISP